MMMKEFLKQNELISLKSLQFKINKINELSSEIDNLKDQLLNNNSLSDDQKAELQQIINDMESEKNKLQTISI